MAPRLSHDDLGQLDTASRPLGGVEVVSNVDVVSDDGGTNSGFVLTFEGVNVSEDCSGWNTRSFLQLKRPCSLSGSASSEATLEVFCRSDDIVEEVAD